MSATPIYKEIIDQVTRDIQNGKLSEGQMLPSMNELAASKGISRETVKNAYSILRERGYIESVHGKGFFIARQNADGVKRILVLFDKLSTYKDILLNAMTQKLSGTVQLTIKLHNQNIDLLKYYLDENLDKFDCYVVTPHFPLDPKSQTQVLKQLSRIPNRKLIIVDHWMEELPGNYGVVYQEYSQDIYDVLKGNRAEISRFDRLHVLILPSSLYHDMVVGAIRRFCEEFGVPAIFDTNLKPEAVKANELYILVNSQVDSSLNLLAKAAEANGLEIGKDIGIISYNDAPMDELVLGGLTTASTDFHNMGELTAEMILKGEKHKIRNPFRLIRRKTF